MRVKAGLVGLPVIRALAREERIERSVSVALVGYGRRGEELLDALARVPGMQVAAVADVWPWRCELARERMRALRQTVRTYATMEALLADEGGRVDAVVVATPEWQHANHVTACLKAGKHVYCEGELSDSVEKARELVRLSRERRLLVQGGHQRRSNPRYIHAFESVCREGGALGRVTHAYVQWHRGLEPLRSVPARFQLPTSLLEAQGYENMEQFLNWEWFRRYGNGGVVALAAQKLDLLRWLWRAEPESVSAVEGYDTYGRETPDALMAMVTLRLASGERVRGYIQVLSQVSRGGSYEQFMGEHAALVIAEVVACGNAVQPEIASLNLEGEVYQRIWRPNVASGRILPLREPPKRKEEVKQVAVDARVSPNAEGWPLPIRLDKPPLQPHLENFAAAIRGEAKLNDPAEQAFANRVALEGVLRAARERCPADFRPTDFEV